MQKEMLFNNNKQSKAKKDLAYIESQVIEGPRVRTLITN